LNISVQGVIRLERAGLLRCINLSGTDGGRAYNEIAQVEALANGEVRS
jgi:hypothetical protein